MAAPVGISLTGTDFLGTGAAISGVFNSRNVSGCGPRPWIGKKAKEEWQQCVDKQQQINERIGLVGAQRSEIVSPGINPIIIIAICLAMIFIIWLITKK
jgi:hypothetical protein